jgi:hypothetical protein
MSSKTNSPLVDVIVNVYGKPYQTAVSLWSLMKFSEKHIGKIYVILEKKQPEGFDETLLRKLLVGLPVEIYTPPFFFGWWEGRRKGLVNQILLWFKSYRNSIRYQYAWEKSKAPFLFLMHNDMLIFDDLIGHYLSKIGPHAGIGQIGQCWNCPAFGTHCDGDRYWDYRPTPQEVVDLYESRPEGRAIVHGLVGLDQKSWPMPECRLNEHAALIQMSIAKRGQTRRRAFPFIEPSIEKVLTKDLDGKFTITDNIVEKIKFLEENPEIKEDIRRRGKDYILSKFNVNKIGSMWVDFINDLM